MGVERNVDVNLDEGGTLEIFSRLIILRLFSFLPSFFSFFSVGPLTS